MCVVTTYRLWVELQAPQFEQPLQVSRLPQVLQWLQKNGA